MPQISFFKKDGSSVFLDPREGDALKTVPFETRTDPLTGDVSRILAFRRKYPQLSVSDGLIETTRKICPFCPDHISAMTPSFPPELFERGRPQRGEATLIPNAFPYSSYSGVVVICREHFLYPDQIQRDTLRDAFILAADGIASISRRFEGFRFGSINWNYLPEAGAGLFHPHLQIIVEDSPTRSHKKVLEGLKAYGKGTKALYWEDLLEQERRNGDRYIGRRDGVEFLSAFAPRGVFGEITILFPGRWGLEEITHEQWGHFCEGLLLVFSHLRTQSPAFNLSIFSGGLDAIQSWIYARLCPRMSIPPWNISDINYFEKLHDEVVCMISPEELAAKLRPLFL
jgi:galactose-1-phosphate uridylyltransferase